MVTKDEVFEALKPVQDPEHPISITDPRIGIVKKDYIDMNDNKVSVQFKPTVPYCPMGGLIGVLIRKRLEEVFPNKKIEVSLVPGTHSQEDAVNQMVSDNTRYNQILSKMKEQGMA